MSELIFSRDIRLHKYSNYAYTSIPTASDKLGVKSGKMINCLGIKSFLDSYVFIDCLIDFRRFSFIPQTCFSMRGSDWSMIENSVNAVEVGARLRAQFFSCFLTNKSCAHSL